MRRQLSQLLIITLMLISPLSFSTDQVPNFAPEYQVSLSQRQMTGFFIAVVSCPGRSALRPAADSAERHAVSPPFIPYIDQTPILHCSRAPPWPGLPMNS